MWDLSWSRTASCSVFSCLALTCLSPSVSFNDYMLPHRGYVIWGGDKYKKSNLFESLNSTAQQLSNYTNKQEFKGSGHNLLQLFCFCAAFGTSFDCIFPHLSQNYIGWKSSESWHFLEALLFRISFQGTGEEITLTYFLHFELQIVKKLNCFCSWKPEHQVNKCLFFF